MASIQAFISFDIAADADSDIVVVARDRVSARGLERLVAMAAGRQHFCAIRFDGDEAGAVADARAHAAERRQSLRALYA